MLQCLRDSRWSLRLRRYTVSRVMEDWEVIMLSFAGLLTVCLIFRNWPRANRRPSEQRWEGHGMDVTGITDRVQDVRNNFAMGLLSRPHAARLRRDLVASARQAVGQLAYFQRHTAPRSTQATDETEPHAAS
jgi:hypothetical protein